VQRHGEQYHADVGLQLMRQYIDAESSSSDGDDSNTTPYRAPIAYEKKDWSLRSRCWMGDTEALEYLRFT